MEQQMKSGLLSKESSNREKQAHIVKVFSKITQKYTMDKKKLEALEEEFQLHPDGIKVGNFVWLMKAAINHTKDEKYDLVYCLQKLFAEIDINGDEHMEWSEFTQYIIDAVIQNPSMNTHSKDILSETKKMKYSKYYPSKIKDKTSHNSFIKNVIWCQKFQCLMVLENNQKQVKMMNSELDTKFTIALPVQSKEVYIIDCDYSNEHSTFGMIDSDNNMLFWDYFITLKHIMSMKSPCLQLKLKYLKNHKTWITIGKNHVIREYDLTKKESLILTIEGHRKLILDVIEIDSPFSIASASLDSTIRLYSLVDKAEISVLSEHSKGVRCLSYNSNYGGFILSAGFERNIYVWSPEVTTRKSLIGKLEGHTEIVVTVKFLNTRPFCVSIDEKFNLRFWDVRTLNGVQVIANEANAQVPIYGLFIFHGVGDRFVILSKRLLFYDTIQKDGFQNNNQLQLDEIVPLKAEFNSYYLNFTIVTQNDIRIYNAKDGQLQKIIQNIHDPVVNGNITAFCMDEKQRKFYIGDSSGGIKQYNISNGVFIKQIQEPFNGNKRFPMLEEMDSHEISHLNFISIDNHETQLLISSSWDSSLVVFDEEVPEESHLLRHSVGGHVKEDICCLTVSTDLSLIATGSCSGIIAVWDFESNKVDSICMEHNKQISSLHFLFPYPVLISTCTEGFVCIWGMKPCPLDYRNKLIKKIRNNLTESELCFMKMSITSSAVKYLTLKQHSLHNVPIMIIGDDSGYIHLWNLQPIVQELRSKGFKEVQSISKFKMSFNPKKNAMINGMNQCKTMLYFAELNMKKLRGVNSVNYLQRSEWYAHGGPINSIAYIESPDGIISCSSDKHVKLWSMEGELWGDIYLLKESYDKQWKYPFDWSEKKVQEVEKVKVLMQVIQGEDEFNPNEDVIFEQKEKKGKVARENIDYLAKRTRRQEIEEQYKRQYERSLVNQNQEKVKAQYVSLDMQQTEQAVHDGFRDEVNRIEASIYNKTISRRGLLLALDRDFEKRIYTSERKVRDNLREYNTIHDNQSQNNNSPYKTGSTLNSKFRSSLNSRSKLERRYIQSEGKNRTHQFNEQMFSKLKHPLESIVPIQEDVKLQSSQKKGIWFKPPQKHKLSVLFDHSIQPVFKSPVTPQILKSAINNFKISVGSTQQLEKVENMKHQGRKKLTNSSSTRIGTSQQQMRTTQSESLFKSSLMQTAEIIRESNLQKQKTRMQKEKKLRKQFESTISKFDLKYGDDELLGSQLQVPIKEEIQEERKVIVGINTGARNGNAKFLQKISTFIGKQAGAKSRMDDKVSNLRYKTGEGERLLKLSYHAQQLDHKELNTKDFGFYPKPFQPKKRSVFTDENVLDQLMEI